MDDDSNEDELILYSGVKIITLLVS
jgi:hypothetical protein